MTYIPDRDDDVGFGPGRISLRLYRELWARVAELEAALQEAERERDRAVGALRDIVAHDQCERWPEYGGCHVAMLGIAERALSSVPVGEREGRDED